MKPALSVIFFTVSSGAGLGLLFLLALARLFHSSPPSANWWTAFVVAIVLITLGLLSSTLHLANRKNAWRAFSRFKTSWLSREGVFSVALYPVAAAYAWGVAAQWRALEFALGLLLMVLCLLVLYCTAMIYACLKTVPRWHNGYTRWAYPVLGLMSGSLLLTALMPPAAAPVAARMAVVLLLVGAALKLAYYIRFADSGGAAKNGAVPSLNQALNLGIDKNTGKANAKVRLLDVGHSQGTFLTHEFGFELARNHASLLKIVVFFFGFALPFMLLALSPKLAMLATVSSLGGLLAERWLFFAEAKHVVRLYHGQSLG
jgi:sulfite dehydrogenase (quinone) subunit SoeC